MATKGWTPDTNCWKANPHFITMRPFSELYETDEGGILSSNYMWMVILMEENDEEINPQYSLPEETRIQNAKDKFFPKFNKDFELYMGCKLQYSDQTMSFAQRAVKLHQDQIKRYQEFIDNTELTLDTPDTEGKMRIIPGTIKQVAALSKTITGLFKELKDLEVLWQLEKTEAQLKGGRKLTASEKGLI